MRAVGDVINEGIVSGRKDVEGLSDAVASRVVKLKNKLKPNPTVVLAAKKKTEGFDHHVQAFKTRMSKITSYRAKEEFLTQLKMELTIARRVKEEPSSHFPDPRQRAIVMQGIDKYIEQLEAIEERAGKIKTTTAN